MPNPSARRPSPFEGEPAPLPSSIPQGSAQYVVPRQGADVAPVRHAEGYEWFALHLWAESDATEAHRPGIASAATDFLEAADTSAMLTGRIARLDRVARIIGDNGSLLLRDVALLRSAAVFYGNALIECLPEAHWVAFGERDPEVWIDRQAGLAVVPFVARLAEGRSEGQAIIRTHFGLE
ncbi:hypothetical protein [Glaciihabitans sp. dw_435]|uniref:hypothetical protein n=1 Tax=Glaciihabitans sp. dw_435 TaxID=2720081 RepID=UPI001BD42571|nr:hypothetical protein [Glaciihabitans sp. dw_435]